MLFFDGHCVIIEKSNAKKSEKIVEKCKPLQKK